MEFIKKTQIIFLKLKRQCFQIDKQQVRYAEGEISEFKDRAIKIIKLKHGGKNKET